MKKITLIFTLLTAVWGYSQTYFHCYTEDATINAGSGVPTFFNNVEGFTQGTSGPAYEGSNARKLEFNGTNTWFMTQIIHSNGTHGAQDLSAYSYYNVALKTTSTTDFFIRMKGNGITSKILFANGSDPYGFSRDGNWHFMSIPFADFDNPAGFNLNSITELFVLRSDSDPQNSTSNDFEFDHFFMSTAIVLNTKSFEAEKISIYPNPANSEISIKSNNKIDLVTIYNLTGQKVLESNTSKKLNVSTLKTGMYFINAVSNGVSSTSKFIKK